MKASQPKYPATSNIAALDIWENEGGAPEHRNSEQLLGRRIELNGSWTTYHVFSGVPAQVGNFRMVGLSKGDATAAMLRGNTEYAMRRNAATTFARLPLIPR